MKIKITDERIRNNVPKFATPGSAAVDLQACITDPLTIQPNTSVTISVGFALWIEAPSYAGLILARSGLGINNGIIIGNGSGLIDSDYQGELKVCLWNRSNVAYTVNPMDRIAQLVIMPVMQTSFDIVDDFTVTTARGTDGFGSTGI
jgi:dUTP pyrophosphatase